MTLSPEDLWKAYVTCERPSRKRQKRVSLSELQLSQLRELLQSGQRGGNYAEIHSMASAFGVDHYSPAKFNSLLKEYQTRHPGTPELSLEQRREAFKRYMADVVSHATVSSPKAAFTLPLYEVRGFVAPPTPPAPQAAAPSYTYTPVYYDYNTESGEEWYLPTDGELADLAEEELQRVLSFDNTLSPSKPFICEEYGERVPSAEEIQLWEFLNHRSFPDLG